MNHMTNTISRKRGMQVVRAALRARETGASLDDSQINDLLDAFADDFNYIDAVREEQRRARTTTNGWRRLRIIFQFDLCHMDRQSAKHNVYEYMEDMVGEIFVFSSDLLY